MEINKILRFPTKPERIEYYHGLYNQAVEGLRVVRTTLPIKGGDRRKYVQAVRNLEAAIEGYYRAL